MNVRPTLQGFKQTEVGVIPEHWEIASGSEITDLIGKGSSPRWQGFSYCTSGMIFITSENVRDGFLDISTPKYLPIEFNEKIKKTKLQKNDVLINLVGASIGRSCLLRHNIAIANVNQAVCVFRPNSSICPEFIAFYFQYRPTVERILDMQVDVARQNISLGDLRRFIVAIPPLREQKAIADALGDVDALIEALEQILVKKRDLKQGVMQDLLTGKRRLPGFHGQWEIKSLGEIGEALIGLTYQPADVKSDGVLVLRSSNVFENTLRFEDNVYVQREIPERIMVRTGDILICVRNGSRELIGKCAKIDKRAGGMTFGAFMAVYRTRFHDFVFHQFRSNVLRRQIHEHLGATINQITNKSLNSFRIPFPLDDSERAAIATILSDMDAEIDALEQKLVKARAVKQGMMQQLLTGQVRLI